MKKRKNLAIFLFIITPKSLLSRLFGYITRIKLPPIILNKIIMWYSKKFGVINEYLVPENGFKNLNKFFTRNIKEGSHKIDTSKKSIISPVDARIDQFGKIDGNTIIQAKGIHYSIEDLVPSKTSKKFKDGEFMTLYLSPGDYHRIHSPSNGKISGYFNLPGKLYTVQEYMVQGLQKLFSKNERVITYIESDHGFIGVCKVGAMNVGRISLSYDDIITNKAFRRKKELFYPIKNRKEIKIGDEIGIFNLGSTVILLFEKDMVKFKKFPIGKKIRMGEKIGNFK